KVEQVPVGDYELPLGKAEILKSGKDVTVVGYGSQIYVLENAIQMAEKAIPGLSCELIDLRTLLPWDVDTVAKSVDKTGRLVIAHEAPQTSGFAAEIATSIMERCFLRLEAPIQRVCGWDTPFPLVFEKFYVPDAIRCLDAIKEDKLQLAASTIWKKCLIKIDKDNQSLLNSELLYAEQGKQTSTITVK
ncbi:4884_t:CDS:2, partial [Acaulospora morrowiae]